MLISFFFQNGLIFLVLIRDIITLINQPKNKNFNNEKRELIIESEAEPRTLLFLYSLEIILNINQMNFGQNIFL